MATKFTSEPWLTKSKPMTAEEVASYRLGYTDYYSRGSEATDDRVSNLINTLPKIIGLLHGKGVLTDADICEIFTVKPIENDP